MMADDWDRRGESIWHLTRNPWIRFDLALRLDGLYREQDAMRGIFTADWSLWPEARSNLARIERDLDAIDREMESAEFAWKAAGGVIE